MQKSLTWRSGRIKNTVLLSLVPRPIPAIRVGGGGLEPSGEFSQQALRLTSRQNSPGTTGDEAGCYLQNSEYGGFRRYGIEGANEGLKPAPASNSNIIAESFRKGNLS